MGPAVAHFGIRYANDLTGEFGEYIVDSVGLLNSQLASHGMGFFFDAVDVGLPEGASVKGCATKVRQGNSRRGRH